MLEGLQVPHEVLHVRGRLSPSGAAVSASEEQRAAEEAMGALRRAVRAAPALVTLVNCHLGVAGHPPFGGHFSPLAAYHAKTDRYLLLDCWPETQPSWLAATRLWASMAATDADSGLSRGWVVLGQTEDTR